MITPNTKPDRPYRSPFGPDVCAALAAAAIYGAILSEAVAHGNPLAIVSAIAIPAVLFLTGAFR